MADMLCYKCNLHQCDCNCINCGETAHLISETFPLCVNCFGIFLASGETPDPKNPVVQLVRPAKRGRTSRKETLKAFMKEQGWTKADVQKILKSL